MIQEVRPPPQRLVACIARGSRVEEADDKDDPDGRGRIVVDVDVCVMRLGIVGADVLITLSTRETASPVGLGKRRRGVYRRTTSMVRFVEY
jgi:hypothetical protein